MISIIEHIEYLIRVTDCVVIPEWGALIAHYNESYYDKSSHSFIAPLRIVSFNQTISYNDGLLANSIVRKYGISYEKAVAIINEEVASLKTQLLQNREISIGRVGKFELSNDDKLSFEPYSSLSQNINFGLSTFSMKKLSDIAEISDEGEDSANKKNIVSFSVNRNYFKIAASIIVLVIMSFMITTPQIVEPNKQTASFAPIIKKSVNTERNYSSMELEIPIPTKGKGIITEISASNPKKESRIIIDSKNEDKYLLIVSSLQTKELADRHISRANDENMEIIEMDGNYRIYIASSNSQEELYKLLNNDSIKDKYPNAWICRR